MAVRKKETKAEIKGTEVIENELQDNEEVKGEEIVQEVNNKEEVGEETVTIDNTEKVTNGESGDTIVTVDTSVAEDEAPQTEKMVKIKPNCNHRFYYGTKWYVLCEGAVMTVPLEVKERLQASGKLSAL